MSISDPASAPPRGYAGWVSDAPARLRQALRAAMMARDAVAVGALRSCLAAIDNAAAVPVTDEHLRGVAIERSPRGVGALDLPRLQLGDDAVDDLVRRELDEREDAAREYEAGARPEAAVRLRAEADAIRAALADGPA